MNPLDRFEQRYLEAEPCFSEVRRAFQLMEASFRAGGKLLVCGNGGSAADCEHIVGELMKGFFSKRQIPEEQREKLISTSPETGRYLADHLQGALPAVSLVSHSALITAFSNDVAPDMVFAQQVYGYGKSGDVLLGISTSGASKNVIYALQVAQSIGVKTIGLVGINDTQVSKWCDVTISAPGERTPEIQQYHQVIYHTLCEALEESFFKKDL